MNKQRKWLACVTVGLLTQYYFAFGLLTPEYWWKGTLGVLLLYFGSNVSEGIWGKEKDLKPPSDQLGAK